MRTYSEEEFNEQYEDEIEDIFCPICLKRGYKNRLGPKILQPNEPRPEDYDQWLECGTCSWLCPIYAAEPEATIKDAVETSESPFEAGKFQLETIPKRSSAAGKRAIAKRSRKKIRLDEDPEIDELLRIYGDNMTVHK
jgi:hypothetical protein